VTLALLVYLLCALTSLACAILLLRGYSRSRVRLLLWSGLCFTGFFINNVMLVLAARTIYDLSVVRTIPTLAGVALLLYGLIWDSEL
jgi:hypothetical protein